MKILVVDDEPNIVKMVKSRLQAYGHLVIEAFDGEEALVKVESERPDLVILDVMMPKMDGLKVCDILKDSKENRHIPIIMLTAKGEVHDMKTGLKRGADAYLTKPFKPDVLLGLIQGLVGK